MALITNIWTFTRKHKYSVAVGTILIIVVVFWVARETTETPQSEEQLPLITVTSAAELTGTQEISIIGTARALDEASITAEASGRVTNVTVGLGDTVPAGFTIVTIENSSEQAAVLQAEGAYESAVAGADQNEVGVDEALSSLRRVKSNGVVTFQSTYNTVNAAVLNTVDDFFSNPQGRVPGLRIEGKGQTQYLNSERVAFQTLLQDWQTESNNLSREDNIIDALEAAETRVNRTIAIIETFISLFNAANEDRSYTTAELNSFSATFTSLRGTLQSLKSQINNDIAAIQTAEDAYRRAQIGASGSPNSIADAQVKQALGALRSAQANLAKTILQTPVAGTVNSIDVRVGDFVSVQEVVARIANNNALEVITYVGDDELTAFTVGSTVMIEGQFEGIVSAVAPAVDPTTRKTEVRITLETNEIKNGDTVTITKQIDTETVTDSSVIVPLSAVKFEIDEGFVFKVVDGQLQPKTVELGIIRGGSVEITDGLTATERFVLDARGLVAGTAVEVRSE